MPFRLFSGAAFICPEFLYSLKHIAVNNGGLCVGEDTIILQGVLQTLFQFVGLGVGFEVHRTSHIFGAFQNPPYGFHRPAVKIVRHRLAVPFA